MKASGTIEQKRRVLEWLKRFDNKYKKPLETGELSAFNFLGGSWNEYAEVVFSMLTLDTLVNIEEQLRIQNGTLAPPPHYQAHDAVARRSSRSGSPEAGDLAPTELAFDDVQAGMVRHATIRAVRNGTWKPKGNLDYDYLIEERVHEVAPFVAEWLAAAWGSVVVSDTAVPKFCEYFTAIRPQAAVDALYPLLRKNRWVEQRVRSLIVEARLLDLDRVRQWLGSDDTCDRRLAVQVLAAHKRSYSRDDLTALQGIRQTLATTNWIAAEKQTEKGLFKDKEKWRCACGEMVAHDVCQQCGADMWGFRSDHVRPEQALERLDKLIEVLVDEVAPPSRDTTAPVGTS